MDIRIAEAAKGVEEVANAMQACHEEASDDDRPAQEHPRKPEQAADNHCNHQQDGRKRINPSMTTMQLHTTSFAQNALAFWRAVAFLRETRRALFRQRSAHKSGGHQREQGA